MSTLKLLFLGENSKHNLFLQNYWEFSLCPLSGFLKNTMWMVLAVGIYCCNLKIFELFPHVGVHGFRYWFGLLHILFTFSSIIVWDLHIYYSNSYYTFSWSQVFMKLYFYWHRLCSCFWGIQQNKCLQRPELRGKQIQFLKQWVLYSAGRWTRPKGPVTLSVIHHHQTPLDSRRSFSTKKGSADYKETKAYQP